VSLAALLDLNALSALVSVVVIDVALAGDNAVIVGMAAAGLPRAEQRRVIMIGIIAATALRVVFALGAVQLLAIVGLTLAGGILLLWVAWKMYRELRHARSPAATAGNPAPVPTKTFRQALFRVVVADVSMSLDNALAVAGVAFDHPMMLFVGLATSVLLMGLAAAAIARLLERHRWIAYLGLAVIVYVALKMIWSGAHEVIGSVS